MVTPRLLKSPDSPIKIRSTINHEDAIVRGSLNKSSVPFWQFVRTIAITSRLQKIP